LPFPLVKETWIFSLSHCVCINCGWIGNWSGVACGQG
jgi:hypothetical protein